MPKTNIYFSYAWNDAKNSNLELIIDDLYTYFKQKGYQTKRDKYDMKMYQNLISDFIKEIGEGDCIIIGVSDKYLRSEYCMTELNTIYLKSNSDPGEFVKKIFPVQLEELSLNQPSKIDTYLQHWKQKKEEWNQLVADNASSLGRHYYDTNHNVNSIATNIGELLSYLNDMLSAKASSYANDKAKIISAIDQHLSKIPPSINNQGQGFLNYQNNQNTTNNQSKNQGIKKNKGCMTISITLTLSLLFMVGLYQYVIVDKTNSTNESISSVTKDGGYGHSDLNNNTTGEVPASSYSPQVDTAPAAKPGGNASWQNQNTTTFPGMYPQGSARLLTQQELMQYEPEELYGMRNEIYARHGYIFTDYQLDYYFRSQPWYTARSINVENELTQIERSNIQLIVSLENMMNQLGGN